MSCEGEGEAAKLMTEEERDELLAACDTPEGRAQLHPIEVDILDSLKSRPWRTWCRAQVWLLRGLYAKAAVYKVPVRR
jgi:hypothetical protein